MELTVTRFLLTLMDPPLKPSESDCCNSGCNPCILDVYEEQLQRYNSRSSNAIDVIPKKSCMSPTTYTVFKLIKIVQHTHDTNLFTFSYVKSYDSSEHVALIYKPGQHFLLKGHSLHDEDDQFTRAYTPIPINNADPGTFTIVAKIYEDGRMSQFLRRLTVNSETQWRGPYGSYEISFKFRFLLLIAQGTGIAPLLAVIQELLNNPECETFMKLFFCCRTEQDILLRDELYELGGFWNFTYEVFLSSAGNVRCKYNEVIHSSRFNCDAIKGYVGDKIGHNIQVLVCGSETFNRDILQNVVSCGVDASSIFLF